MLVNTTPVSSLITLFQMKCPTSSENVAGASRITQAIFDVIFRAGKCLENLACLSIVYILNASRFSPRQHQVHDASGYVEEDSALKLGNTEGGLHHKSLWRPL